LTIFNAQGEKLFWSAPPEGAAFYYLTFNLSKQVVVVCSYAEKQNGWHDWFYSWDMKRNALYIGPCVLTSKAPKNDNNNRWQKRAA
jgi:hypothetical protein